MRSAPSRTATTVDTPRTTSSVVVPVLAMAVGAFAVGLAEFAVVGLLPPVASDLDVSIPSAGALVAAYAVGVVVGAPLLTVLGARLRRRTLLVAVMGLFAVGNALAAAAPTFELLVVARFVSGLPHGAFFGAAALVAARLAPPDKRASAVSWLFTGLTVANLVGVPFATLLGTSVGWRTSFLAIGAFGLLCAAAMLRWVPRSIDGGAERLDVRAELRTFRSPAVLLMLTMVVLGCGGLFTFTTYLAPLVTDVAGYSEGAVPVLLALLGLGMTLGTVVGGVVADRVPSRVAMFAALLVQAVVLAVAGPLTGVAGLAPVVVFVVGATGLALAPIVQTLVTDTATAAPAMASAALQSAFNIANALGAVLGGAVLASGGGLAATPFVGSALAGTGAVLAAVGFVLHRRAARSAQV